MSAKFDAMNERKKRYRIAPYIINSNIFGTAKLYKVQKKVMFWWVDVTTPIKDKEFSQELVEELNNL